MKAFLASALMVAIAAPVLAQGVTNRDTGGVTTPNTGGVVSPNTGGVIQRDTGGVKTVLPSIQADTATDALSAVVREKGVVKTISPTHMEPRGKRSSHGW